MGATDLHEVLETVPGVHATIQPVTNDYSYTMRGIYNATNSEILLLLNGTRFSVPYQGTHLQGMIIPVEDIQRVEVIRGLAQRCTAPMPLPELSTSSPKRPQISMVRPSAPVAATQTPQCMGPAWRQVARLGRGNQSSI